MRGKASAIINHSSRIKKVELVGSIRHKLDSRYQLINKISTFLAVRKVCMEVANFDIQKIKYPKIRDKKYKRGKKIWKRQE